MKKNSIVLQREFKGGISPNNIKGGLLVPPFGTSRFWQKRKVVAPQAEMTVRG